MGRKSTTGGVEPKGDRIQLTFVYQGKRYRPTLDLAPTAVNLKHAHKRIEEIKRRVGNGTFNFAHEFPDYRFIEEVAAPENRPTFNAVADQFLASCGGLEFATRRSYQKILESFWRPRLGEKPITDIRYGELAAVIGGHPWGSAKTRNNVVSVLRRVFEFAHLDEIIDRNPTERLKSAKVQRQPPDPYTVAEAEAVIRSMCKVWGEFDANYVEFGFFAGARPSELIALQWSDVDLEKGTIRIDKARVMGHDKDTTKTSVVRDVELCPRAIAVLKRQRALTGLKAEHVFGHDTGEPYHDLQIPWKRWVFAHKKLGIRYREPYQMRHTSVTWNLMIGKNLLWVAQNHGHSAAVMLKAYAKWLAGSTDTDVARISAAMGFATSLPLATRQTT